MLVDAELARRRAGEIEDAVAYEGSTIGNAQQHRLSGLNVGDAGDGVERQRTMGRGHAICTEDLAVRRTTFLEAWAVPTSPAQLGVKDLGIAWNPDLGFGIFCCRKRRWFARLRGLGGLRRRRRDGRRLSGAAGRGR